MTTHRETRLAEFLKRTAFGVVALTFWMVSSVFADGSGEVKIPLDTYTRLLNPGEAGDQAPQFAYREAAVTLEVGTNVQDPFVDVTADTTVKILHDGGIAVPIMPLGVDVQTFTIDGEDSELVPIRGYSNFIASKAGNYAIHLKYRVHRREARNLHSIAVPFPPAPRVKFTATIQGEQFDAVVFPAAQQSIETSDGATRVEASFSNVSVGNLSWRSGVAEGYRMPRAAYQGNAASQAVLWKANFDVELTANGPVQVALLPSSLTLSGVEVDGKNAAVSVREGYFTVPIRGAGAHTIGVRFETPISASDGPLSVTLPLKQIPISKIELILSGRKELKISPLTEVQHSYKDGNTIAVAHVPLTSSVAISWVEAVNDDDKKPRTNVALYHLAEAKEGVLAVRAVGQYEITRGELHEVELRLPTGVEVTDVRNGAGSIADWQLDRDRDPLSATLKVFLNRPVERELEIEVRYEMPLGGLKAIRVPLAHALGAYRARGMVALLSNKEFTLRPVSEEKIVRVGDNQIPEKLRPDSTTAIAHTFKYSDQGASLTVDAGAPEKLAGRFDATVDTLFSVGDVSLRSTATIDINVKSGAIESLAFNLPIGSHLLTLAAPSLSSHTIREEAGVPVAELHFTQPMEGQLKIELTYESFIDGKQPALPLDTVDIAEAEVEQGRIAVEALSAVEVQTSAVTGYTNLEHGEIPPQLLLKTSNPILHAYGYVRTDGTRELKLKITRHNQLDVQSASIDTATYRTLVTTDGVAITSASFFVRNVRSQFLRLKLPAGSSIWSATVNGVPEQPALSEEKGEPVVLLKMLNASQGFPVRVTYQSAIGTIGSLGILGMQLPRPDMVVTRTRWEIVLPDGVTFGRIVSDMNLVARGKAVNDQALRSELGQAANGSAVLNFAVPAEGESMVFEKMYATQGEAENSFKIAYAGAIGAALFWVLVAIGAGAISVAMKRYLSGDKGLRPAMEFFGGAFTIGVLWLCAGFGFGGMVLAAFATAAGIKGWMAAQKRFSTIGVARAED